jgi:hypothetical protein
MPGEKTNRWKETTKQEKNLHIYNEEIRDFIPEDILDFHVHVFHEHVLKEDDPGFPLPGTMLRSYTIPELKEDLGNIYPGKRCTAVVFGFPDIAYDSDANNRYVAEYSDHRSVFPFRLVKPDENPGVVEDELVAMEFLGVKPYLNYVQGKAVHDIEIFDMLPEGIMEVVDRLGLMVMLHIPRRERLADPVNQRQIVQLATRFPNAKIILAHIGRAYYLSNIVGQLDSIGKLQNVYCDTAMVNHCEVLEYLFTHFDRQRILYGTDLPIAVCGGKSIEINDQYTYVTSKPWFLSISDDHGKLVFTSFIYEQIRGIRKAVERTGMDSSFLEQLFHRNGRALIEAVMKERGIRV